MKIVIQRVKYANVKVDGKIIGECKQGFLILLGVQNGDTKDDARKLIKFLFCVFLKTKTQR